jgi:hypothetical protein
VGHPFFGVVVALRSVADRFGLEPGAPQLDRLLDAYLETWTALASRSSLRALFPNAEFRAAEARSPAQSDT